MVACVLLLVGYWALLTFTPMPTLAGPDETVTAAGAGKYEEGSNLTNYIDSRFLPGYKWDGDWDPEGLLSNLPAVATGLFGIFAGMLIRRKDISNGRRLAYLIAAGLVCLGLGWLWGLQFPIIKKLWTSSYVLFAAGWSYLLVALFYLVIDVWRIRFWSRPFVWIGMNCITIYVVNNLVGGFGNLVRRVLHEPVLEAAAPWGDLIVSVLGLALAIAFCHFLYRRRIFIRV
jgi:predicted acyltransferase